MVKNKFQDMIDKVLLFTNMDNTAGYELMKTESNVNVVACIYDCCKNSNRFY